MSDRLKPVLHLAHPAVCGERGGFALITVLWLITVLATLVGISISEVRLGNQVSTNRIVLTRGHWAAEACFAIMQARWRQGKLSDTATIDLGRRVRCNWEFMDPTARINLNTADPEIIRAMDTSTRFVQAVLDARRAKQFESVAQLANLPDFDSATSDLWTVDGPGSVNLTAASQRVLFALPGLSAEAVEKILYRRTVSRPYRSVDELGADLSPPGRAALLTRYADLARLVTFSTPQLVVTVTGWVESHRPRSTIEFVVVPLPERLAVIRRRQW
jgi:DNA uptake protein ComE-like DNA-binding protein